MAVRLFGARSGLYSGFIGSYWGFVGFYGTLVPVLSLCHILVLGFAGEGLRVFPGMLHILTPGVWSSAVWSAELVLLRTVRMRGKEGGNKF